MTNEFEAQETEFGKALICLEKRQKAMIDAKLYLDTAELFNWIKDTTEETIQISPICHGGQVALSVCTDISKLGQPEIFDSIISHARHLNIESKVQTSDLKYTTAVVLSMYLDKLGLGSKL